jgi:hypothetical protein
MMKTTVKMALNEHNLNSSFGELDPETPQTGMTAKN